MIGLPDFSAACPHHLRLNYIKYGQKKVILTYLFVIIKAATILHAQSGRNLFEVYWDFLYFKRYVLHFKLYNPKILGEY